MDAWRTDTEAWQKGYKQALSVTDTWAVFRCVAFLLVALSQIHSITNVVTSLGSPATRLLIFKILFLDNLILWWFLRKFIFPFFSPSLLPPILISFHPSFVFFPSPAATQPSPTRDLQSYHHILSVQSLLFDCHFLNTPTTPRQNLLPVEAILETECNRPKSDKILFIKFSKKITFSQLKLHTKSFKSNSL